MHSIQYIYTNVNKKTSAGLYIGRFQPFHLGHLSAIKQALKKVTKLYIAIGSSQYSGESKNPFTAKERKTMIELTLKKEKLSGRCKIFEIPDIHNNKQWVAHVRAIIPPFKYVFLGNYGLVYKLFKEEGKAELIHIKHEVDISATRIRQAMKNDKKWRNMVNEESIKYLESINAVKRLQKI